MNSSRYKTLLAYLPGMASVVNSFESEQVQIAVFDRLISALEEKTELAESNSGSRSGSSKGGGSKTIATDEIEHELVEGESIHAVMDTDI